MTSRTTEPLAELIREAAHPLTGARDDFDPIQDLIGDARIVLIGEATHGTHEFYRARAEITKRLIRERGCVVYLPKTERLSHYFSARLPDQFDGILHYDETRAVEPLERTGHWDRGELPETYPTAL